MRLPRVWVRGPTWILRTARMRELELREARARHDSDRSLRQQEVTTSARVGGAGLAVGREQCPGPSCLATLPRPHERTTEQRDPGHDPGSIRAPGAQGRGPARQRRRRRQAIAGAGLAVLCIAVLVLVLSGSAGSPHSGSGAATEARSRSSWPAARSPPRAWAAWRRCGRRRTWWAPSPAPRQPTKRRPSCPACPGTC